MQLETYNVQASNSSTGDVRCGVQEPAMGMAFPAWNGLALTTRDLEELIWHHPQFDDGNQEPEWNFADCECFIAWH